MEVSEAIMPGAVVRPRFDKMTGHIGAMVSGVHLSEPLSPEDINMLSAALVEHKVLFFRDQPMTRQQHRRAARQFGPLALHPLAENEDYFFHNADDDPEVVVIESHGTVQGSADEWHSDLTILDRPPLGTMLRCLIAPAYGGDTLFADMAAAYEGLDDAMRNRLSGLIAIHDWTRHRENVLREENLGERTRELLALYPPKEQPLVRTHPVSGEKVIYVNPVYTRGIKGMSEEESQALLDDLFRLAHKPEYQVRFRWQPNSVALWDNRSTQHYAVGDFYPQHRLMERVTIEGDEPF